MQNKKDNQDREAAISRRRFITGAAATAVAATTIGGGTALLQGAQQNSARQAAFTVSDRVMPAATAVPIANQSPDLFSQLAAAQADNVRLQAALDAAQSQLAALQQNNQNTAQSSETLQLQLGQANERIGVLAGLVALYEQMEAVDFDALLAGGTAQLSEQFDELIAGIPTLNESIAAGRNALQEMEEQLPQLQNGRRWVKTQIGRLQTYFAGIETMLQQAVDNIGPFLEMLNDWFAGVKKWLPFGIGEKAAQVMAAITTLLMETPETVNGLDTQIVQPLDNWLAEDDRGEAALQKNVIRPLQTDVLDKTSGALSKAQQAEISYKTGVKEPLEAAATSQRLIRQLIAEYRQTHQV